MAITPTRSLSPETHVDPVTQDFGSVLRDKIEKIQTTRTVLRILAFGLTASFLICKVHGPEAFLILVPEIVAFWLFRKMRQLLVAHRRVRTAALFQDSFGAHVDVELGIDLANDMPNLDAGNQNAAIINSYYASNKPSGIDRLLENIHESVFYWAAVLRHQRHATTLITSVSFITIIFLLLGIYFPGFAPGLLLGAALIVTTFFVSEQVNEIVNVSLFHREFVRLEKDFYTFRKQTSEPSVMLWMVGRYFALSHSAPIVPSKLFENAKQQIAEGWNLRNQVGQRSTTT